MITARPDQSNFRQSVIYNDQHGRPWIAVIDTQARTSGKMPRIAPCIPFQPHGWNAPLDVPQKYLTIPEGSLGKVEIDYDTWFEDARAADRDRTDVIRTVAFNMYGQQAAAVIKNPTPELLAYVGRGPIPAIFIRAARAGNRWVLGQPQPNGQPYPTPQWALPIIDQLIVTMADPTDEAEQFADEVFADETIVDTSLADEVGDATTDPLRFEDDEEFLDPEALGGKTVPVSSRPPRAKVRR